MNRSHLDDDDIMPHVKAIHETGVFDLHEDAPRLRLALCIVHPCLEILRCKRVRKSLDDAAQQRRLARRPFPLRKRLAWCVLIEPADELKCNDNVHGMH